MRGSAGSAVSAFNVVGYRACEVGRAARFDDDGVATQQWDIVRDGILTGFQLDRSMAALFDRMYALRQRVAHNAGFANFQDYVFQAKHRFDYSPADCARKASAARWNRFGSLNTSGTCFSAFTASVCNLPPTSRGRVGATSSGTAWHLPQ